MLIVCAWFLYITQFIPAISYTPESFFSLSQLSEAATDSPIYIFKLISRMIDWKIPIDESIDRFRQRREKKAAAADCVLKQFYIFV